MYDLLPLALVEARFEVVPANAKMYDLLPLLWSRSGPRCEVRFVAVALVSKKCYRFVAVALVSKWCPNAKISRFVAFAPNSKWCPNAKMYDLKPLLWSPRCPNAEMCDLLPLLWSRSGAPMLRCMICCRCFGSRSGAPMLRCTICCRCFGLEVVLQC